LNGQTWLNSQAYTNPNRPVEMSVLAVMTTAGVTADRLFSGKSTYRWDGDIAELLIYTKPLTSFERKQVEDYLTLKYAPPFAVKAGAPVFTPNGATFTESVEVSLATPTPGADIRYTTDASEPNASSPLYTSPLQLSETTVLRARAFREGLEPSPVSIAHFSRAEDLSPASVPGLVLWARADVGVVTEGEIVTAWTDSSGRGNDLKPDPATPSQRPLFVSNAHASLPAVRFDGVDDSLQFTSKITTIRTVFWVVRADPAASGLRFLLGGMDTYDFYPGPNRQLWNTSSYLHTAIRSGETRVDGVVIDGMTTNRPTASPAVISLVTTGNVTADAFSRDRSYLGTAWWGDLAELIVYDRALSNAERQAVEAHLALKYGLFVPALAAPTFDPPFSTSAAPVRVRIHAIPGAEVRYTMDGSEPDAASALYIEPVELTTPTTLKARAFREGFTPSPIAASRFVDPEVPVPVRIQGLKLWVKADAGVAGTSVAAWEDQSGNGNHLVQGTLANQPQLMPTEANGLPALRFDGLGDALSFTTRLTTIRSVFWVIRSTCSTQGYRLLLGDAKEAHFFSDGTTKLWRGSTSLSILNGETRLNGTIVDGRVVDRPTELALISVVTTDVVSASTFSNDRGTTKYSWCGDLAELLIYDRPLPEAERHAIEGYLGAKYQLFVPTVAAPTISLESGSEAEPPLVQIDSATPGATIRYTLDDSEPTEASVQYSGPFEFAGDVRVRARAFQPGWNTSAETVATFYGPAAFTPASLDGLSLWVRGDAGVSVDRSLWRGQGAASSGLVQEDFYRRPTLELHETSRMPLLRFDGKGDFMSFATGLTEIRTVFWVIRRNSAATGVRMLLGDAKVRHFSSDNSTKLWQYGWTSFWVLGGETRLNGQVVDGRTTDRPTNLSVLSLVTTGYVSASTFSKDRIYDQYSWWGDLAELVIYRRALSPAEVRSVEEYLAGRYGIALEP
jgi:hypothetical protein